MLMTSTRSDRGFSMFLAIMAMFITAMFVAAAFAAANGDLPISGQPKDRKVAYAAAEAGLNFYETHLNADPDYWTHCDNVPAPNGTDPNPVNLAGANPLRWRNVSQNSPAQYTIEILPTPGNAKCVEGNQATVLDQNTGTFRIRVTGRPRANGKLHRSIIATFKRKGFLDYLWFTDVEDKDPASMATVNERNNAMKYCQSQTSPPQPYYRWQRPTNGNCTEIQWITGDLVDGPLHSNDSLLICNSPQFGGSSTDKIEVVPRVNPRVTASGCTDNANMKGQWRTGADKLIPPADDQPLKTIAQNGGDYYSGETVIRLNSNGTMTVTNGGTTSTTGMPDNGVIFVDGNSKQQCDTIYPSSVTYGENDTGCGNVYVSGTYARPLTIASSNDVILAPTAGGSLNWSSTDEGVYEKSGSDAVLGLIAQRFVRVGHAVNRCANVASGYSSLNLEVDAAILALQHSWIVDNYDCGQAGKLSVNGAIAQEWRGPVGTGSHTTGYLKDYHYDKRLRYRSPPYFLSPVAAQWSVVRQNEQVPAA
jgi:Tfp pilus assembly protein PilX